jgi:predicted ribosomally synthesized peptide with SipW-like signal peptide
MNKKIILSLSVIGAVAAIAVGGTIAYFSDTETSTGNTFTAGNLDLKIDSQCTYNGAASTQCGTWQSRDLVPTSDKFFNFADVKPGDIGENTISLTLQNNPGWACMYIKNLTNNDNGCNNPETKAGDTTCGANQGELQTALLYTIWLDPDCSNTINGSEAPIAGFNGVTITGDTMIPIADSQHGGVPLPGATTKCVGVSWTLPSTTGNIVQSDSVTADLAFYAVQSRNNLSFVCPTIVPAQ